MSVSKDFECPICFKLLYKPVTTACGHNFCKTCIEQVTSYCATCPLCRSQLCLQYAPNTLLSQLINDMFADEMRQRVEEVMTNAKTDESQYRDRCNQGMEDEGPLPLLYLNSRSEALFPDERITVTLNKVDAARLMQFVSSRNGRILIVCEKSGPGKQFGAMADITESNIPDDLSDPFIMATIQTVVVERVEIVGTESETPYSWTTSCYRILHDDFIFPETDEQNHLEELEQLQQAIATKCVGQDSLIPEFKALENIIEKDTTPMDRYVICCQLVQLCSVIAKHQLQYSSLEGQRHFEGNFSQLAIVGDKPTSGELEYASMYYARLVIAKRKDKLRWYYMKDTFERLVEVTKIYVYAGDKFILQFHGGSPFSLGPFWSAVALLLFALVMPRFIKT